MFFGLKLTDEQKVLRDAIYGEDYDIIFCNSKAGTGKTTIVVATAKMLVAEGKYDGLVYIVSPVQEGKQ
jgi:phosphate starvation-inducible PhoH-like protein